ncbi:MAG: DUF294 nucleotidyltransferase-like domain-containing protein [Burkholderiales bacterium]
MTDAGAAMPAAALLRHTTEFLRRYPPFDRIEEAALQFAVTRLDLAYFPRGTTILSPERGVPEALHIIQKGTVSLAQAPERRHAGAATVTLGPGECFSVGALLERRAVSHPYTAAEDSFCYRLPADVFEALCGRSEYFRVFCTDYLKALLRESRQLQQARAGHEASAQVNMLTPMAALCSTDPVACTPETKLREVLRSLSERRVGAMIVVDAAFRPVGIFTRSDLLDRVILAGTSLEQPIGEVMTRDPVCLPREASAHEAALQMAQRGIRHVLVVEGEGGRLAGIVSERDLFALQRVSLQRVHDRIAGAGDRPSLQAAAADVRALTVNLLGQGVAAEPLTQLVSALNDQLTARILALEVPHHPLDGVRWCWLAFGSEGRSEQTFATDQDNGLVFVAEDIPRARAALLAFARVTNDTLDACGFPLCRGNIMAGNPELCLTPDEWKARFASWTRDPDPEALLKASIFFDLRALGGATELGRDLRTCVRTLVADNRRFQHLLAANALQSRPPLGVLRDFVVGKDGTLDLKTEGARLFVDAARIFALSTGVEATGTAVRLREAGPRLHMAASETEAAVDAFYYLQSLRLRGQQVDPGGAGGRNRLDPDTLHEVDRRILKEALRQARRLQTRLALDFEL